MPSSMVEEADHLLEDSWFFGNLLHTKTRTMSRSYSDLASSSCSCPQEQVVKNERKSLSFSSRNRTSIETPSLSRRPKLPALKETQSFVMKKANPSPNLTQVSSMSDQEDDIIKNEQKNASFSSRNQPPIAPPRTSKETQSFLVKKVNPSPNLTRVSSMSDQQDDIVQNEPKNASFSSRKQPSISPPRTSKETQPNPSPRLMRASSMSTFVFGGDQEDEEDQESEFTMGKLIRQASMNSSHTSKGITEDLILRRNQLKKPELDQEEISEHMGKLEINRNKSTMDTGKIAIPGGFGDKSSSEDIKAHIKFWARAVASNVRQEC